MAERKLYFPQNNEERAILNDILECRRRHQDIILEREKALRKRGKNRRAWLNIALELFAHRALEAWVKLNDSVAPPPKDYLKQYDISPRRFEECKTPPKYRIRPYNLLREYYRLSHFAPEVFSETGLNILDLSSGSCANHEILSTLGRQVTLADFQSAENSKGPFFPFWEHYGIEPKFFDGRTPPFDFGTTKFDLVLCNQSINFYCEQDDYPKFIPEICRLSRKKVVIVFNAQLDNASRERNIIKIPKLENLHGWSVTEDICPETLLPSLLLQTSLEL